jgi:hypothetical protein
MAFSCSPLIEGGRDGPGKKKRGRKNVYVTELQSVLLFNCMQRKVAARENFFKIALKANKCTLTIWPNGYKMWQTKRVSYTCQ